MEFFTFLIFVILLVAYFFPSIIAGSRNHHNKIAILITNLFLGWTFIGWVVCLIWSFTTKPDETTIVQNLKPGEEVSVAEELEKLSKLKNSGIISEEEFEAQKEKLLS
tara:strand:+ start:60 stop:383 length:324 start_codon:yes stop_codon:yes gene_type:complete